VARGPRPPDRFAADRTPARAVVATGREPSAAGYAKETGANFLTPRALDAATARTAAAEPHQTFDQQRVWADLLSSPAMAFNLFGDLAADLRSADRAVRRLWSDSPGAICDVRFAHSPGRFDPAYLNSLRAFDAAFVLALDDGTQGILAIDTKYHERINREIPRPENRGRYLEVHHRSGAFTPDALHVIDPEHRTDLCEIWLEHLLLLSMLQHEGGGWSWGRYVVVHPAGNTGVADVCARYRDLLAERSTFATLTLEDLLDAKALPAATMTALRRRYLPR